MDWEALTQKKIGKVPVIYIGGVAALGIGYYAWKLKSPPVDTTVTDVPATDATSGNQPDFVANVPLTSPGSGSSVTNETTTDTNDAWARRCITWLISQGYSIELSQSAIGKFLEGSAISTEERPLIDKAVAQFGFPPVTPPPSKTAPYKGPASKQGTPPVAHTVKGTSDDSYAELARLYFGMSNGASLAQIQSVNAGVRDPFQVGQVIQIPKPHNPVFVIAHQNSNTIYEIAKKNGTDPSVISSLNPNVNFPVKPGTRVRVK